MNYFKYILLFCLILFPITSKSYGLTNSWCSNGKYSTAISPFPKPQFNKCPGYAKIIMTKKEVTDYYLNGLGKDYLCKLTSNPLFFVGSKHKREDYEALKLLFKPNQVNVAVMCAQLNRTKSAKKKAEEAKQKATANVNKGPKDWCLPQNKYQRNIPFHKLEDGDKCPSNTYLITDKRALKILLIDYGGYINKIIESGDICNDTYKNYKYLRELIKDEKNLDCKKIIQKLADNKTKESLNIALAQEKAEELAKQKTLAEKKAEEEARIRALAEKLAKEEIARQLKVKQKEEEAKQKALAAKKAKEDAARKKALAKKKAEKLAKQKAIAAQKAKEDKARKKALAKEKAEELAKQKAIAAKKAEEEELKQRVLNEKIQKIKDEAKFVVATLKEYVTTDNNKLDILEVSELLENYNNEMQKGWTDTTVEKYEELYDYVQKDEGFIEFSADKKSKQLAAYNEEIIQLREYLTTSQSDLKSFITKNLGSNNASKALKLAKETKQLLKDFEVNQAMTLKNNISTWKAMNGVAENKKYTFKILNKKTETKKQSVTKQVTKKKSKPQKNTNKIINISKKDEGRFSFIGMCSFTFEKALYMLRNNKSPKKENYKKMLDKVDMELASISRKYKFTGSKGMNATGIKAQKLMQDNYNMAKNNTKENQKLLLMYIKKCQYEFPIYKKQSNFKQPQKRNLKVGYIYKYYTDNSCRSSSKERCISKSEMKSYCNSITGISQTGYRGSLTFARDPYGKGNNQDFRRYAARNTGPEKFNTYLTSKPYPCWVSFNYSGTYKGTSFTNTVNQPVLTFLKTKDKILVHATKSF